MLQVQNLKKTFGSRLLFSQVTFNLNKGDKVGLVGRNGQGKTTLLKILQREEGHDEGQIIFPKNYSVGYLQQHLQFTQSSILEEVALALKKRENETDTESVEKDETYLVKRILAGLGFAEEDWSRTPQEFSGGYQIRLHLAKVLLSYPNLLLLDEPTNYLDILAMRWLKGFLRSWKNELIIISHDQGFMDQVCTHTMGFHGGKLRKIVGNTQKYYEQIQREEEIQEKTRVNQDREIKAMEEFIDRFRAKASKASLVQSRVKALERKEGENFVPSSGPEEFQLMKNLKFQFSYHSFPGKTLLKMEKGTFSYPSSSPSSPLPPRLFQDLSFTVQHQDRIAIIGKNGRGKSTLLKALVKEIELTSGEVSAHPQLKMNYFGQTNIQRLNPLLTIEEEIATAALEMSRGQVRSVCGTMLFSGDEASKKVSVLSGGEKSRVLLGKILCTPANCLLLDEPTHHLDMESIESLLLALGKFQGGVLLVTHQEKILQRFAQKLIVFLSQSEVIFFDGTYDEFLEKIGWGDEEVSRNLEKEKERGSERERVKGKEAKMMRAEIIRQRSQELGPLRKELERVEKKIISLEEELKVDQEKLISLSQQGGSQEMGKLSKNIKFLEGEVESLFEKLEELSLLIQEKEGLFEKKLKEFQ